MKTCQPCLPLPGHSLPVRHYGVFPKSLAQIISHYDVAEVHLSLTQGQWRTNAWGYPPRSSPPGAELWAWFMAGARWDGWSQLTCQCLYVCCVNGCLFSICERIKSIAVECIAVVSHFFDLTHISTCSCQSHRIAHNTLTTRTYIHVDIGAHVVWMFGGRGWPTPCLVSRVPLSTSSTLPPPSSRCLHSDPEEQWLVSSDPTLHLVLAGGVCGVCVWAAIRT